MPDFFVSGATGMLGANLVKKLVNDGHAVRVLVRDEKSSHPLLEDLEVERCIGDLELIETLAEGMRNCNNVIHCAGMVSYALRDREKLYKTNRTGTENMVMAAMATDIDKFVHVSSTATVGYSNTPQPLNETAEFKKKYRKNAYMHSKWLAEEEVRKAAQVGFKATIVNPSTIYGAGDINFNNGQLFANLISGRLKKVPPGGNGMVAVDDVVEGILCAFENGQPGERYILNSDNMSYGEFFHMAALLLEIPPLEKFLTAKNKIPIKIVAELADLSYSMIRKEAPISSSVIDFSFAYRYFSSESAEQELGWQPRITIKKACEEAIAFYRQQGRLPQKKADE